MNRCFALPNQLATTIEDFLSCNPIGIDAKQFRYRVEDYCAALQIPVAKRIGDRTRIYPVDAMNEVAARIGASLMDRVLQRLGQLGLEMILLNCGGCEAIQLIEAAKAVEFRSPGEWGHLVHRCSEEEVAKLVSFVRNPGAKQLEPGLFVLSDGVIRLAYDLNPDPEWIFEAWEVDCFLNPRCGCTCQVEIAGVSKEVQA